MFSVLLGYPFPGSPTRENWKILYFAVLSKKEREKYSYLIQNYVFKI